MNSAPLQSCCGTLQAHYHQHQTWPQPAPPASIEYNPYNPPAYLGLPHPYAMRAPQSFTALPTSARTAAHEPSTLPSPELFDRILDDYIRSLSPKKRDKALISRKRYENIMRVLQDPKCTTIESAQFRHWAKKMFELGGWQDGSMCVLHRDREELRPVAVKEELYEVLTSCHLEAQHGGRDKTALRVKQRWSWVPKELVARFVRYCPSCSLRRSSPSKARQQKLKREESQNAVSPVLETKQEPDYSYPTPAQSPSAYVSHATPRQHPHLLMPNTQVHEQQHWTTNPAVYWETPYE